MNTAATNQNPPSPASETPTAVKPLKPLKIGNVEIGFPIVQAALSGYSDWPMRVIAKRLGAPYTICEVMLDEFLVNLKERKRTSHFLHISDEEEPVGGQLMGAEPDQFAAGAVKLVQAGFHIIDINFGCPVKKVLGRRGIDDTDQSRDQFFEILDGAFAIGVDAITVHGRTVKQRYVGPSRWEFLKEVKQHIGDNILLGSGDLFTAADCLAMIEQTGVDGVTVARGAIGNPWIFNQARALAAGQPLPDPPRLHEQKEVLLEHYRLAEELYGPDRVGRLMRKFGIKYAILHPEHDAVRSAFVKVKNMDDWKVALDQFYSADGPGCHPDGKMHAMSLMQFPKLLFSVRYYRTEVYFFLFSSLIARATLREERSIRCFSSTRTSTISLETIAAGLLAIFRRTFL